MGYLEYIIFAIVGWFFYIRHNRLETRVLDLEKRWAESQRRQSMYKQSVKPSKKALESMGDFGITDIEDACHLDDIRKRLRPRPIGYAANKYRPESSLPNCPDPPDPPEPKPPKLDTNIPGSSLKNRQVNQ